MCVDPYLKRIAVDRACNMTPRPFAGVFNARLLRVAVLIMLTTSLSGSKTLAESFERTIAQFQHTAWGAKEGAPGQIRTLAQTKDGYLWLGTADGLYRFDGLSFERYEPQGGGPFPGRDVRCLLPLPNGDLWIGFWPAAISLLRNGSATNYTVQDGVPPGNLTGLTVDNQGRIWASSVGGLIMLKDNKWKNIGEDWGYPGASAQAIFEDRHGTLWVATEDTLVFLPPNATAFQTTRVHVGEVLQISEAPNGRIWMAETTRSVRPVPLDGHTPPSQQTEIRVGSAGILFDREGALWATTLGDGLRRAPHPDELKGKPGRFSSAVESFTAKNGLTDNYTIPIIEDREGNIWVGTKDGLDRFRKSTLVPVSLPVPFNGGVTLAAGNRGDLWVRGTNLWVRVHGRHADAIRGALSGDAMAAYHDPAGTTWWVESTVLRAFANERIEDTPLPQELRGSQLGVSLTGNSSGGLWLAVAGKGVYYVAKGVWKRLEIPPDVTKLVPGAAFTDWMGRVWIGYSGGTIVRLDSGAIQIVSSEGHSPVEGVRAIQGRPGHIWVGGERGLAYFDGTSFHSVVPTDAAAFDPVFGIEEIADGSLWLCDLRGVIHIEAGEVGKFLGDPSYRVRYKLLDTLDGLPGIFHDRGNAAEVQGTDGRLWFAASGGIAWLDPANIPTNSLPPPISIRSLTADGKRYPRWTNLVLPPLTKNLQIQFTALSLSIPERVRFRYKLDGLDSDWQDGGTRRDAFYTNLAPGDYQFRVTACNNEGVWNEIGTALQLRVTPAWYQTIWFRSLCAITVLVVLWALYELRVRQLARRFNMLLEERVSERTRIARELHDTLLQNLHGLMFQFQAASNLVERRPEDAKQTLDTAIDETEKAIAESQDAIRELRSEQMAGNNLGELLTRMANELASSQCANPSPPVFSIIEEGEAQILHPSVQDEVYRIAREVIRNAFQHAEAHRIEIEIRYDPQIFRLRVRDDGKGIERQVLGHGRRAGHWGLPGIYERAQRIGAKLDLWSEVGAGTEVQVTFPAHLAYETPRSRLRLGRFRRAKR